MLGEKSVDVLNQSVLGRGKEAKLLLRINSKGPKHGMTKEGHSKKIQEDAKELKNILVNEMLTRLPLAGSICTKLT